MGSRSNTAESIKEAVSSASRAISENPEIEINTAEMSVEDTAERVINGLIERGIIEV